ncbi:thioesterase [Polymorphobacter glacialis]|uniref:Thioesterase n=1 Tax=Sandarakinorhabdus glacialis TaxID=1614636 RepID=A0A916ZPX5_9SPHN|nr:thioesterase family protein [Polymorphobacter glacialis]GGE08354.1 thioesterase [Polymorphobacter glacialis]
MARADFRFSFPKRVRFAEIDAQAVVFNARYLEYFDIGLVEYWRAAGMYDTMGIGGGPEFHVARALVEYKKAIALDEMVAICVRCRRIGTTSMTVEFELHGDANGEGGEDLRATGEEVHVHVAEVRGRPAPLPDDVIARFERYEGRSLRS